MLACSFFCSHLTTPARTFHLTLQTQKRFMIFEDASHHRWQVTLRVSGFLVLCFGILFVLYLYSKHRTFALPTIADTLPEPYSWLSTYSATTTHPKLAISAPSPEHLQRAQQLATSTLALVDLQKQPGYFTGAFLLQENEEGLRSLHDHVAKIDAVMPDWYTIPLSAETCQVTEHIREDVRYTLHQYPVAIIPRLANYADDEWKVAELRALLRSPTRRSCFANSLADAVRRTDSKGINIDLEGLTAEDRSYVTEFFLELATRLREQRQLLTVDIPADVSAFDLHTLAIASDAMIIMAYDQHFPSSSPGPIAAYDWTKHLVQEISQVVPAHKLVLGTANYSYDWAIDDTREPAASKSFAETMEVAATTKMLPTMDLASRNPRFGYIDMYNQKHEVWFLDANTLWNQHRLIQDHGLVGATLWRLGTEDPLMWKFFGADTSATPLKTQETLFPLEARQLFPTFEAFVIDRKEQNGEIYREFGADGTVTTARYTAIPLHATLEQVGHTIPDHQLTLTFTEPLDHQETPALLDFLNQQHLNATFFVTDEGIRRAPEVAKAIVDQGFAIGITVPAHAVTNAKETAERIERTQRTLIELTGTKTTLFQSPLLYTDQGIKQDDARMLPIVSRLGYISLDKGVSLDPVVTSTVQALTQKTGHILGVHALTHKEAASVLATVIPSIRAAGYRFVPLDQAIGVPNHLLQTSASSFEILRSQFLRVIEALRGKQWVIIAWIFLFTNVFSICRILFLAVFALRSKHEKVPPSPLTRERQVTVVIPAYNEEKTIKRTIEGLQQSTHTNFIALVVNDGSTDRTATIVERMQKHDRRIQLLNKPNGGKFSALNLAFARATTEIVVTIDADTILYPETINALIQPFEDPAVDAVCGNVQVGNVCNLLTGFQAVEYITSQNFDRRAFEKLNCIGVVPGATGAWRRERVLEIGGYEADTLVEDADVTLRLLQHGGKIVYAPEARSCTEAPATLHDLAKQRLRWSFGTFQCLSKHAKAFFHGTLGWIALPNIFFFQILYPILSPIGDAVFLWALFTGQFRALLIGYTLFLVIDFVGSVLAFRLEHRSPKLLLLLFIQRFFYRQFMYVIAFRSVIAILRGTRQGWNKLARQGTVRLALQPVRRR